MFAMLHTGTETSRTRIVPKTRRNASANLVKRKDSNKMKRAYACAM